MGWFSRNKSASAPEAVDAHSSTAAPLPGEGAGGQAAPSPADVLTRLTALVVEISKGELTDSAIDVNANLYDQGYVDSLSLSDLLLRVEKIYLVRIEDWQVGGSLDTLSRIADYVLEQRTPSTGDSQ